MTMMKRKIGVFALMVMMGVMISLAAFAMDLQGARDAGLVGEKLDGYVAVLKPSGDVNALVSEVNAKRNAEYSRISKENNQPVDVVAKLAAPKIIANLSKGHFYQAANGAWTQK